MRLFKGREKTLKNISQHLFLNTLSLDLLQLVQTVVEIVVVLHPYPLVLLLDVLGAHRCLADGQGVRLTLSKYRHHLSLVTLSQFGIGMGEAWTHDVGPGEDELDGALVHPLGGEQEGELVEQSQGGDPSLVVMSPEEQVPG